MENTKANICILKKAAGSYTHHGIGIGDDMVIHYSGLADGVSLAGEIEKVSLESFSQGQDVLLVSGR